MKAHWNTTCCIIDRAFGLQVRKGNLKEKKNLAEKTFSYSGTKCEHIIKDVFAMAQRIFCISQFFLNRILSKLCRRSC